MPQEKKLPSIHITEDNLAKVLIELELCSSDKKASALAIQILTAAKKYTIHNRKFLETKPGAIGKIHKSTSSATGDAYIFAQVLVMVRRTLKHQGISLIKEGSRDWLTLKEVTMLANDFCNAFGLNKKEGYKLFCQHGLARMKKFSLTKFNTLAPTIADDQSAKVSLEQDLTPHKTERAIDYYNVKLADLGSIPIDLYKDVSKRKCFIDVVENCSKFGVSIEDYIDAQFAGLAFAKAIPDPLQLTGDNAIKRLNSYLHKHGITRSTKVEKPLVDFSKLKGI